MSRGVLYIAWGARALEASKRSIASIQQYHPELPYEFVELPPQTDPLRGLLEKSRMMELSPFDETLFLDADTVVLDRLDFGFEQAQRFGVACCICESPWARRYPALPQDDGIEYNTGVLFFTRKAEPLFRRWRELTPIVDSHIQFMFEGKPARSSHNDQGAFAVAVREWDRAPFILPLNWNFRPPYHWTFFGPIKVWHDYESVPDGLLELNAYYKKSDAIIRFHYPTGLKN
jgi:hypothetical protein